MQLRGFGYDADGALRLRTDNGVPARRYVTPDYHVELPSVQAVVHHRFGGATVAWAGAGGLRYALTDRLGSAEGEAGQTGADAGQSRHTPFGSARSVAGAGAVEDEERYTGQRRANDGGGNPNAELYHYGARAYLPGVVLFTQPDGLVPDPTHPEALNRYAYCLGNPLKYADPTGHWPNLAPLAAPLAGGGGSPGVGSVADGASGAIGRVGGAVAGAASSSAGTIGTAATAAIGAAAGFGSVAGTDDLGYDPDLFASLGWEPPVLGRGTGTHRIIQWDYKYFQGRDQTQIDIELFYRATDGSSGYVDLRDRRPSGAVFWEIKPASDLASAIQDRDRRLREFPAVGQPGIDYLGLSAPVPGLTTWQAAPGVILYQWSFQPPVPMVVPLRDRSGAPTGTVPIWAPAGVLAASGP